MKIRTFVVGYVLALALFLFAQHHTGSAQSATFRGVVDLTHSADPRVATQVDAPAHLVFNLWTVDQIPPERLVAPLVVLDVSGNARNHPDYQISVADIAAWEQINGEIPLGAVVMARTGWDSRWKDATRFPGYSADAAKFLIE